MFEAISEAPPDAILGLLEAYRQDPNPEKINLSVGVYQDEEGRTPVMRSVKAAEEQIWKSESTKSYLGIAGAPEYASVVQEMLLQGGVSKSLRSRLVTVQTPGGTGALRVAADFLSQHFPQSRVWLSTPTWPNHPTIFSAAGLEVLTYPYFEAEKHALDWSGMAAALETTRPGDVVVLHGCCHNPTGVDLAPEQWRQVAEILDKTGAMPLLDFAYQGFGEGLVEDAAGLRELMNRELDMLVASSFSKNFGLYRDRVGALSALCSTAEAGSAVLSQIKRAIRANYSNPPAHGALIVSTVFQDETLRGEWEQEVAEIRQRLNGVREMFAQALEAEGIERDFSHIRRQRGMFSFSGLEPNHIAALREKYSIYMVGSGRINVAGINRQNIGPLCRAIKEVLAEPTGR